VALPLSIGIKGTAWAHAVKVSKKPLRDKHTIVAANGTITRETNFNSSIRCF
jgi:hypothetical protein